MHTFTKGLCKEQEIHGCPDMKMAKVALLFGWFGCEARKADHRCAAGETKRPPRSISIQTKAFSEVWDREGAGS